MTRRTFPAILAFITLSFPQVVKAGTLIVDHLADVEQVSVKVLAPRYEPIPGRLPDTLEAEVERAVADVISQHDLKVVESADQRLVIDVDYEASGSTRGIAALLVIFELREPASLTRKGPNGANSQLVVTSWRARWLEILSDGDVLEHLLDASKSLAKDFCEATLQSKAARAEASGQAPESAPAVDGIEKPATKILICSSMLPNALPSNSKDFYLLYAIGIGEGGIPVAVDKIHDRYASEREVASCLRQWSLPDVVEGSLVNVSMQCDRETGRPVMRILGGGIHQEIYPANYQCN